MKQRNTLIPASYIILRRGDEVLLLRRKNTGWRDGEYTMPAGHVETGESPLTCAIREAKEEAGVTIKPENIELMHIQNYPAEDMTEDRVDFIFEASEWRGEPYVAEPHKSDDLRWCSLNRLPKNIVPPAHHCLNEIRLGNIYSDFGLA